MKKEQGAQKNEKGARKKTFKRNYEHITIDKGTVILKEFFFKRIGNHDLRSLQFLFLFLVQGRVGFLPSIKKNVFMTSFVLLNMRTKLVKSW